MATRKIYVVSQMSGDADVGINFDIICAFLKLESAKKLCLQRASVTKWLEHDSHGLCWESQDGDGSYYIEEVDLHA